MFDAVTQGLIRSAPELPGLSSDLLVDELTAAYVEIASARLAAGRPTADEGDDALGRIRDRMGRLADTYEGYVILGLQADRLRSAAFVAGAARQVLAQLDETERTTTILDDDCIGPEIAASLLFLIAERSSDAYEASRGIRAAGEENKLRRAVILTLGRFARGQFEEIAALDVESEASGSADAEGLAVDILYREVLKGLKILAEAGLGLASLDQIDRAQAMFDRVRALAVDFAEGPTGRRSVSLFAGPHHLAGLLSRAAGAARESCIVGIGPPQGSDPAKWKDWLGQEARRWPFLWENHKKAIATGYLDRGSSLVMTTPTGSGKSTLAALKVAATLSAGKAVVYLAPTHALVGQVERDLNERLAGMATARAMDDINDDLVQSLPDLTVTTPERCLALLTFSPELFHNVGLLIFDEFHLLGASVPSDPGVAPQVDRRNVDAMLCLVSFLSEVEDCDYLLLSAMVSNGHEVAAWLRSLLLRPVHPFDDKWKPTRQLRSCVTYARDELSALRARLRPGTKPSVAAVPLGLFSLSSGWNPGAPNKLLLRPFAPGPVALKVGGNARRSWLTSNRYEVAATLAGKFAAAGMKVVVFCESIPMCASVARRLNETLSPIEVEPNDEQKSWRDNAISELGSSDGIYNAGIASAAVHHGELLPSERRLVESIYRSRDSGLNVLAATTTLAQGLNLPCDVVIVAGTDRLDDSDPEEKRRSPIPPHELLNALGRAGRAGWSATGFSIVIPGNPTEIDPVTKQVLEDSDLRVVFAEGDQCLPILDPVSTLFDRIEVDGSNEGTYLLRRMAASLSGSSDEAFDSLARRTFGYFRRSLTGGGEAWLASRREIVRRRLAELPDPPTADTWDGQLSSKTGASPTLLKQLLREFPSAPNATCDAMAWVSWLLMQLDPTSNDFDVLLNPETLGRVFGRGYSSHRDPVARRTVGRDGLLTVLPLWLGGETLQTIEQAIVAFIRTHEGSVSRPTLVDAKSKRARRLSIRLAPDLGFLCGVLSQVAKKVGLDTGYEPHPFAAFLPTLLRRGYSSPYHLALAAELGVSARPLVSQMFTEIAGRFDLDAHDDWATVQTKVQAARLLLAFSDEDIEPIQSITLEN